MKVQIIEHNQHQEESLVGYVHVAKLGKKPDIETSITINTLQKWEHVHCAGSTLDPEISKNPLYFNRNLSFMIGDDGYRDDGLPHQETHQTEVVILAENEEESKLLSGIRYMMQDTDQIEFIIKPLKLTESVELASFKREVSAPKL